MHPDYASEIVSANAHEQEHKFYALDFDFRHCAENNCMVTMRLKENKRKSAEKRCKNEVSEDLVAIK